MTIDPFASIRRELDADANPPDDLTARIDFDRRERTGIPEVIYGESKSDSALARACERALGRLSRVIVSRVGEDRANDIVRLIARDDVEIERPFPGTTVVLRTGDAEPASPQGYVAILTAGTSDLDAAGEAATLARELGCRVEIIADVGVAGLHRLVRPLRRIVTENVGAIIVAAGMDGALPSVVAGLVNLPVIGLPTSVGYGVASGGHAALNTMLSSCAPGLTVVNIDNGVGAGAAAARIALRSRNNVEP